MSLQQFQQYRPLLFSIAYRMLGTVSEAEDVLQDAFLRWQNAAAVETIENPKYYLTTIVTRLSLNVLSSARVQREEYLGPWLPEPVLTDGRADLLNPAEQTMIHDSISVAFLLLLETLSPAERAVFILHEVFDYKFREISEIVGKNEANCRQLFRRAKEHIAANRPRFETNPADLDRLLTKFIETVETGEIDAFLEMLAADVKLVPDGGGQRGAAIRVVNGREAVAAFIQGTRRLFATNATYEIVTLNGQRAILARTEERRPFFAVFLYVEKEQVQLLHVIAGSKLKSLTAS
jgi:RNA polymerase sigma-70 factor (ECF subfamily)